MAELIRAGDVVLVDGVGQGLVSVSIAAGEMLRYGRDSPYARWTHAAIVYDAPDQDPDRIKIVEATGGARVHKAFISKYESRSAVVHTRVDKDDWGEVKKFLDEVLEARAKYDPVAYAGLTVYALTGTKLCVQRAGTATCSGLVADALTRRGFVWKRPPYAMTPADIAADLERFKCAMTEYVASVPTPTIRARLRQFVQGVRAHLSS
jgi:hypothetical protein